MKPLHEELREIREERGISIHRISEETRIRPHLLEAIEAGDFSVLPKPYIRAFMREYAQVIGIDPDRMIARLDNKVPTLLEAVVPSAPEPDETTETTESVQAVKPAEEPPVTAPGTISPDESEPLESQDKPDSPPIAEAAVDTPDPAGEDLALDFEPSTNEAAQDSDKSEASTIPVVDEEPAPVLETDATEESKETTGDSADSAPARGRGKRRRGKRRQAAGEIPEKPEQQEPASASPKTSADDTTASVDKPIGAPKQARLSADNQLETSTASMPEPEQLSAEVAVPATPPSAQTPSPTTAKKRVAIEEPGSSNALFFIVFFLLIVLAAAAIFWMNSGG